MRRRGLAAAVVVAALLCGCKTELFTKQVEADVNVMLAALRENGVRASKESPDGGKTWNLMVESDDMVRAVAVLEAVGLPQKRHDSLGQIFKKDGLISTPTEERVRFIHGVSQELSETISRIDGVISARVHIVLPNNDPLAPVVKPSSASVFVKYRPHANLSGLTPAIKNMVARSVEGLSYDNVSITLVPGQAIAPAPPPEGGIGWGWYLLGALLGLASIGAGGLTWLALRRPERLPKKLRDLVHAYRQVKAGPAAAAAEPAEARTDESLDPAGQGAT
ncbi:MAG TPA: type III secretion inner membrane ring lipoprotein SctJ [Methylibium sp.]|nr:type III secretion inner membrane ring lipoprotein SctJ [Methylibium sp.]